jgi:hypothetical protein
MEPKRSESHLKELIFPLGEGIRAGAHLWDLLTLVPILGGKGGLLYLLLWSWRRAAYWRRATRIVLGMLNLLV